jgi:dTDP-glucose 4,6-dehydratase
MKKVLLTGAAGFVGSHLVDHILENTDWHIVGLDSFKHRGDSLRIRPDFKDRYQIYTCDVGTAISERLIHEMGKIDYIINMASDSHVDRSIIDPVPFVQNNVNVALYMLECARVLKPEKFIQISTDEVYGAAPEGVNHAEWSPILPSNPYAASKACQEAIAISYWRTYGVPLMITNTMNMFGERQDKEKYIPMLISKIIDHETVTIHGSEDYIGKRHYLHARNFSDALLFLLKQDKLPTQYQDDLHQTIYPDRYNVVGEIELNNLQVAKAVSETLGMELKYNLVDFHHARPGHDRRYSLDGSKLSKEGWLQPQNFKESLKQVIAWTLKNPVWMK